MEKNFIFIFFSSLISFVCSQKILFASETFRHGARNPIYEIWDYKDFPVDGQLTPVGMREHYLLGKQIKKRYIKNLKLLSPNYNPEELFVRSTLVNRTLMSAESHLLGIYEGSGPMIPDGVDPEYLNPPFQGSHSQKTRGFVFPGKYQPIPIETKPKNEDKILLGFDRCPLFDRISNKISQSSAFKDLEEKYKSTLVELGPIFKKKIADFDDVSMLIDVYYNYKFSKFKFPINFDIEVLKNLFHIYIIYPMFQDYGTSIQKLISASEYVKEFIGDCENVLNGKTNLKMRINSAHDSTLLGFMSAFNITSFECQEYPNSKTLNCEDYPIFASNLLLELWNDETGVPIIKMIFNGKPMKLCSGNYSCPFEEFKSRMQSFLDFDYDKVCSLSRRIFRKKKLIKRKIRIFK